MRFPYASVRPLHKKTATSLETCWPLHRKMPLHWKCHSSLQSTSKENVTSMEMVLKQFL